MPEQGVQRPEGQDPEGRAALRLVGREREVPELYVETLVSSNTPLPAMVPVGRALALTVYYAGAA